MLPHELLPRAWRDAAFKAQLIADPKKRLAEHAVGVPAGIDIAIHENTAEVLHLVIPERPDGDLAANFGTAFGAVLARLRDDPAFKGRLQSNPASAIAEVTGLSLPAGIHLVIHCDTATTRNAVIPIDPATPELSEASRYVVGGSMQPPRPGR